MDWAIGSQDADLEKKALRPPIVVAPAGERRRHWRATGAGFVAALAVIAGYLPESFDGAAACWDFTYSRARFFSEAVFKPT